MSKKVFCQKYQKQLDALDSPPFPGELGQKIQQSISKKAWDEWIEYQVMVINEYQLNLMEEKSQKFLNKTMNDYLFQGIEIKLNQKK